MRHPWLRKSLELSYVMVQVQPKKIGQRKADMLGSKRLGLEAGVLGSKRLGLEGGHSC